MYIHIKDTTGWGSQEKAEITYHSGAVPPTFTWLLPIEVKVTNQVSGDDPHAGLDLYNSSLFLSGRICRELVRYGGFTALLQETNNPGYFTLASFHFDNTPLD